VEFDQAGFIAGAARFVYYWTPSAITRQLQRLEAALGARGYRGLLGVKNGLPRRTAKAIERCIELLCKPESATETIKWDRYISVFASSSAKRALAPLSNVLFLELHEPEIDAVNLMDVF
jgi:hypothetical protein